MIGRFLGGVILNWMKADKFLTITSIIALIATASLFIVPTRVTAFIAIAVIGLSFANIFPLIFSIAIDSLPQRSNEISGLMVTAIIGGALVPLVFGAVADSFTLISGFIVPFCCILYVIIISIWAKGTAAQASVPAQKDAV
jgi:fucose permease